MNDAPNEARKFHPISLDAVNFLLADVRGALARISQTGTSNVEALAIFDKP